MRCILNGIFDKLGISITLLFFSGFLLLINSSSATAYSWTFQVKNNSGSYLGFISYQVENTCCYGCWPFCWFPCLDSHLVIGSNNEFIENGFPFISACHLDIRRVSGREFFHTTIIHDEDVGAKPCLVSVVIGLVRMLKSDRCKNVYSTLSSVSGHVFCEMTGNVKMLGTVLYDLEQKQDGFGKSVTLLYVPEVGQHVVTDSSSDEKKPLLKNGLKKTNNFVIAIKIINPLIYIDRSIELSWIDPGNGLPDVTSLAQQGRCQRACMILGIDPPDENTLTTNTGSYEHTRTDSVYEKCQAEIEQRRTFVGYLIGETNYAVFGVPL
ncbi:hypothetical protein ACWJJH_18610 [Endozoicomonadaceae bacterium StTr2]